MRVLLIRIEEMQKDILKIPEFFFFFFFEKVNQNIYDEISNTMLIVTIFF